MLRPQCNTHRDAREVSGVWDFRAELDGDASDSWSQGVPASRPIAVPGSWNEQLPDLRDFCGVAWYQTELELPPVAQRRRTLRFGSVNYAADVWVNGRHLGGHAGGHLPFELDATDALVAGRNRIVVRVDAELAADRVPPGEPSRRSGSEPANALDGILDDPSGLAEIIGGMFRAYPNQHADFFPFGGIHRPVLLTSSDPRGIGGIRIVESDPSTGVLRAVVSAPDGLTVSLRVGGVESAAPVAGGSAELEVRIPDVVAWSPASPVLHDAEFEVHDGNDVVDRYRLPVGMRTVRVDGTALLLNGEPVVLRGFGRHEDFAIVGRGHFPAGNVRDFAMMRWMGANSFRTSHYPYSEEQLDLADRLGFLVIAETPAVGLGFADDHVDDRLETCLRMTTELIERDRNRPSVVLWSLANEPMMFDGARGRTFFESLVERARSLDDRPLTIVNPLANRAQLYDLVDVVGLNAYSGWYTQQGDIAGGTAALEAELRSMHEASGKPIALTEFGCDTLEGHHAEPPEMFSEEYQADFLESYIRMLDRLPFVVTQHVWNLADFKTGQGVLRAGSMNRKGVLTRERRPKLAAHRLRELWKG